MVRSALEFELTKAATDLFAGDGKSAAERFRRPIDMTNSDAELRLALDLIGRASTALRFYLRRRLGPSEMPRRGVCNSYLG